MAFDRQAACDYALAQLGKPYVWAAAGPEAFDCSGLCKAAVEIAGGPFLPHHAASMVTTHGVRAVPLTPAHKAQLKLGDLVFYYGSILQPETITHCALFIGVVRADSRTRTWEVVAAVDERHGVMRHRMNYFLHPCGFGYVEH